MQASLVFQTKKGYNYLYDANCKDVMLVHPSLASIAGEKHGYSFKAEAGVESERDEYYPKMYDYLKRHGWFRSSGLWSIMLPD